MGRFRSRSEVKRFFESHPDFPRRKHGEIRQQRVDDIFNHPLYTGYICSETYRLEWLKGQHEALISLETFDKVQQRIRGTALAPVRKNIGDDFALRGFATCGECGVPLRSSWSKGKYKRYLYYLCQNKSCSCYGKSIPRDKLEGAFGEVVKSLQPSPSILALAKAMFHNAWSARDEQIKQASTSEKRQITEAEKQIETLLGRIMSATNDTGIGAYEDKIATLEKSKIRLQDKLNYQRPPQGMLGEVLELSLKFLSSPWKLRESGNITSRRLLLRLAFTSPFAYHRNEGTRTPEISLHFKALGMVLLGDFKDGAAGEN